MIDEIEEDEGPEERQCEDCEQSLPVTQFHAVVYREDKLDPKCKSCRAKSQKRKDWKARRRNQPKSRSDWADRTMANLDLDANDY